MTKRMSFNMHGQRIRDRQVLGPKPSGRHEAKIGGSSISTSERDSEAIMPDIISVKYPPVQCFWSKSCAVL
jgi:hypothetical protein